MATNEKYLGVDIWNSYIDRITGNVDNTFGYVGRNLNTKTSAGDFSVYLGPLHQGKTLKLERIQRRAARWSNSNYGFRSNVTAMLELLSEGCPSLYMFQNGS